MEKTLTIYNGSGIKQTDVYIFNNYEILRIVDSFTTGPNIGDRVDIMSTVYEVVDIVHFPETATVRFFLGLT